MSEYWKNTKIAFERYVEPYLYDKNYNLISKEETDETRNWVGQLIKQKDFSYYGKDVGNITNRYLYGKICEIAVEKEIKFKFVEWNIRKQFEKDRTDLTNLGIQGGVKGSKFGEFPLVEINSQYPEVICIRQSFGVYVCGLATVPMLKHFMSEKLALDNVKNKKMGFWGFKHLIKFKTKDELLSIFNNKEILSFSNFNEKLDLTSEEPEYEEVELGF